ncbi:tetratricopeptide repeat protein [Kiloniella sp. EL199]|uniref:tetratricopeptide repeat protein n=1 Tax=Kiloniella sp. EL199 TaxID=2107581 RepID=UPI000EA2B860|nr:SEL1-like repeat protein [Kiloniella sp. EL199]
MSLFKFILFLIPVLALFINTPSYSNKYEDPTVTRLKEKCEQGDAFSCYQLGELYIPGNKVLPDVRRALEYFNLACEGGYKEACEKSISVKRKWDNDKKRVTLYTESCKNGNAENCFHLGSMYNKGEALNRNEYLAFANFKKACDGGFINGCAAAAFFYSIGRGVDQDRKKAVDLLNSSCEAGGGDSCLYLGFLHEKGMEVGKKRDKKIIETHQICDLIESDGCKYLSFMYIQGLGVEKNYANSVAYYKKGCALENRRSCSSLKRLNSLGEDKFDTKISIANMNEAGKKREALKYIQNYETQCKNGDAIKCTYLGTKHILGNVVARDEEKTTRYFQLACDQNEPIGCYNLAGFLNRFNRSDSEVEKIATLYDKACDENIYQACDKIGEMYMRGKGVEKSYALAEDAYRKSCFSGENAYGCIQLSNLYRNKKNKTDDRSVDYEAVSISGIKKDCRKNIYAACLYLGEAFKQGMRVTKDYRASFIAFKLACDGRLSKGCDGLSFLYLYAHIKPEKKLAQQQERFCRSGMVEACVYMGNASSRGLGVEKNITKAISYYKESCLFGSDVACRSYEKLTN